jgi:hypothetical protein
MAHCCVTCCMLEVESSSAPALTRLRRKRKTLFVVFISFVDLSALKSILKWRIYKFVRLYHHRHRHELLSPSSSYFSSPSSFSSFLILLLLNLHHNDYHLHDRPHPATAATTSIIIIIIIMSSFRSTMSCLLFVVWIHRTVIHWLGPCKHVSYFTLYFPLFYNFKIFLELRHPRCVSTN